MYRIFIFIIKCLYFIFCNKGDNNENAKGTIKIDINYVALYKKNNNINADNRNNIKNT